MRYFVTRHNGAADWAKAQGFGDYVVVPQAEVAFFDALKPGDIVAGTLPLHLAAKVCAAGAQFLFLALDLPADMRGKELSPADMERCGAKLEPFFIATPSRRDGGGFIYRQGDREYRLLPWEIDEADRGDSLPLVRSNGKGRGLRIVFGEGDKVSLERVIRRAYSGVVAVRDNDGFTADENRESYYWDTDSSIEAVDVSDAVLPACPDSPRGFADEPRLGWSRRDPRWKAIEILMAGLDLPEEFPDPARHLVGVPSASSLAGWVARYSRDWRERCFAYLLYNL